MMKRFFLFSIAGILLISMLSGCSRNKDFNDILICSFSDSVPEIKASVEYTQWSQGAYVDPEQPQIAEVRMAGTSYQGTYVETELAPYSYELRHFYQDENKNYFQLDEEGNLTAYYSGNSETIGAAKSQEACEKIVSDFIAQTTKVSLADYVKTISYDERRQQYTISFTKYIGQIPSKDQATVVVEESGTIYSIQYDMLGKILESEVPKFNLEEIQNRITARLDLMTEDAREKYDEVEYKSFNYSVSMSSPSQYVLLCTASVYCINHYGEYSTRTGERILFVVPLT